MNSDIDHEKVREEAKKILENFVAVLEKADVKKGKEDKVVKKNSGFREETGVVKAEMDFIKQMFDNAPEVEDDCIIAEKRKW